jgi:glycosyltransferase involved in cell wall biosynthesis
MKKPRVLFILKLRQQYGYESGGPILKSAGLLNSATFVHEMLLRNGYETKLVQVVDNNSIDREVTLYKPDVVIIEALWVVPEKFDVLQRLHPDVKWVVRLHSDLSFLANEGIALEWINAYVRKDNVFVSANSKFTHHDLVNYLKDTPDGNFAGKLVFLPNYYPVGTRTTPAELFWDRGETIDVGCFGAIRPMKNHLAQAVAAIEFADRKSLKLRFHINAGRTEQRGESVLKNLRALFAGVQGKHELVEHGWLDRPEFLALVDSMDLGLQVSFSETFNIVSADFVDRDIPIVTSDEVDWMPKFFTAKPTDTESIVRTMNRVLFYDRHFIWLEWQRKALQKYVRNSELVWLDNLPKLYYC